MHPCEAGAVLDHARAVYGTVPGGVDDVRRTLRRLADAPDGLVLAARAGGRVVGIVSVDGGVLGISVRPGWRRRGIARRLLDAAIARAAGPELRLEVDPANRAARALYRAAGFREAGPVAMTRAVP